MSLSNKGVEGYFGSNVGLAVDAFREVVDPYHLPGNETS